MVNDSFLYVYLIFNAALFLFGFYIFFRISSDLVKKNEYLSIKTFIIAFEVYLVFNTLWTMAECDVIALPRGVFITICMFSFAAVVYNSFCFFAYTMIHFDLNFIKNKKALWIGFAPCVIALALLVISLFNGMIFSVTPDNNVVNGPAYIALPLCSFIYFVVIVAVSIGKARRVRTRYARRDALGLTACVVFLVAWVILDGLLPQITIIPVAIFAVIFFLFISMQQSNIYTDALTKLNNRRRTEEYLAAQIDSTGENSPMYVFMGDVDSFKQINDRFGHLEGDNALVIISDVIKDVIAAHGGFAARYGGDEFIWVCRPSRDEDFSPEKLIDELCARLDEARRTANIPYDLSLSAGYARCADPSRTIYAYIKEADEMMYESKKEYHDRQKRSAV